MKYGIIMIVLLTGCESKNPGMPEFQSTREFLEWKGIPPANCRVDGVSEKMCKTEDNPGHRVAVIFNDAIDTDAMVRLSDLHSEFAGRSRGIGPRPQSRLWQFNVPDDAQLHHLKCAYHDTPEGRVFYSLEKSSHGHFPHVFQAVHHHVEVIEIATPKRKLSGSASDLGSLLAPAE